MHNSPEIKKAATSEKCDRFRRKICWSVLSYPPIQPARGSVALQLQQQQRQHAQAPNMTAKL